MKAPAKAPMPKNAIEAGSGTGAKARANDPSRVAPFSAPMLLAENWFIRYISTGPPRLPRTQLTDALVVGSI